MKSVLQREQVIPRPPEEIFDFFADPRNLEAITPPWLRFQVLEPMPDRIGVGSQIRYRLSWHGVPLRWVTEVVRWDPPFSFVDMQLSGPYRLWEHTHALVPEGGGTRMVDTVRYRCSPVLNGLIDSLLVRRDLEKVFDYRAARIVERFGRA